MEQLAMVHLKGRPYPRLQILDLPVNIVRDKPSRLFCRNVSDEEGSFISLATPGEKRRKNISFKR